MKHDFFQSEESVQGFVGAFEKHSIPRSEWNHKSRLTVTIWYLLTLDEADATTRLISGLRALVRSHRLPNETCRGYNETTTMFWIVVTKSFLSGKPRELSRLEQVNCFLRAYAHREALINEYYSSATLESWRARSSWVEPDVRPMIETEFEPRPHGDRCNNVVG